MEGGRGGGRGGHPCRNATADLAGVLSRRVYMDKGFPYSPPQPTVRTQRGEVCSFTKDDHTPSGAVGVLTYELFQMRTKNCTDMMAVMFSVPFDYNLYKNWAAIGIFPKATPTDEKLYDLMYNGKGSFVRHKADGGGLEYSGGEVDLAATMSDEGHAIIKLEIHDRGQ